MFVCDSGLLAPSLAFPVSSLSTYHKAHTLICCHLLLIWIVVKLFRSFSVGLDCGELLTEFWSWHELLWVYVGGFSLDLDSGEG